MRKTSGRGKMMTSSLSWSTYLLYFYLLCSALIVSLIRSTHLLYAFISICPIYPINWIISYLPTSNRPWNFQEMLQRKSIYFIYFRKIKFGFYLGQSCIRYRDSSLMYFQLKTTVRMLSSEHGSTVLRFIDF